MKGFSDKLRFGSSYCPYAKSGDVDVSVWERDFKTMKALNFNAVRCFVSWDRAEPEEGKLDFSKTDHLFDLAEKYGIDVILNAGGVFATYGGIYPPRWLLYDYHCQETVKDPQHPEKPFGPYRELCADDETYRAKAEAFTVKMIKRYASRKSLFGWNVWNEAYLKPQCFCHLTLAKFREWLKAKYNNDLDALNKTWGSEFPVLYRNWEDIEPGLASGFLASGCVARIDWLQFNQARVASWISGVCKLVKKNDPLKRPTSSNIVTTAVYGDASWHGQPDIWSQAESLDIAGFSYYTCFGDMASFNAGLLSVRGSSNDPAKGFWVLETEAGQIYYSKTTKPEEADGPRREATHWLSVLHGAKTILVWKFGGRVTDTQTETFNLTAWDGSITRRAEATAKIAKTFIGSEKLFLNRVHKAEVAILHSGDNALFANAAGNFGEWQKSRFGAARLMRDLHIQADCVGDKLLREGRLAGKFKALLLPCAISMDKTLAKSVADFVKAGGFVIADQRCGIFDENGVNQLQAPGLGLKTLFGAYENDYLLGAEESRISLSCGNSFRANANYRSLLHRLSGETEILGRYDDGGEAISLLRHERGAVLFFGFQPFRDYYEKPNAEFLSFMRGVFSKRALESDYELSGQSPEDDVELAALTGDDGAKTHFLINLSSKSLALKLKIKSAADHGPLKELLSGKSFDFSNGPLDIELPPWRTMIFSRAQDSWQDAARTKA